MRGEKKQELDWSLYNLDLKHVRKLRGNSGPKYIQTLLITPGSHIWRDVNWQYVYEIFFGRDVETFSNLVKAKPIP